MNIEIIEHYKEQLDNYRYNKYNTQERHDDLLKKYEMCVEVVENISIHEVLFIWQVRHTRNPSIMYYQKMSEALYTNQQKLLALSKEEQ